MQKSVLSFVVLVGLFGLVSCSALTNPSVGLPVIKQVTSKGAHVTRGYLDFAVTSGQAQAMAQLLIGNDLFDGVKDNVVFFRADVLQLEEGAIIRVPFATVMSIGQLEGLLNTSFPTYEFDMTLVESYHGPNDFAPTNGRSEPKWNVNSEQSEVNDWG